MTETVLKIGDIEFPIASDRAISQDLNFIDNGDLRRTVNGALHDLTRPANRKFESSISASGFTAPAFSGIWRGQVSVVECIAKFRQTVSPAASIVGLIRDYVPGSVEGRNAVGDKVLPSGIVLLEATFPEDVIYVEYRPILTMMVEDVSHDVDEASVDESWAVSLLEV